MSEKQHQHTPHEHGLEIVSTDHLQGVEQFLTLLEGKEKAEKEARMHLEQVIRLWKEKTAGLDTHPAVREVLPALVQSGMLRFVTVYSENAPTFPHRYHGPFDEEGEILQAYVLLSPAHATAKEVKVFADWEDFLTRVEIDGVVHNVEDEAVRGMTVFADSIFDSPERDLSVAAEILGNALQMGILQQHEDKKPIHTVVDEIGSAVARHTPPSV